MQLAEGLEDDGDRKILLQLLGEIAKRSIEGENNASITSTALLSSRSSLADSFGRILRLSHTIQLEGFQTDEAVQEDGTLSRRQLTVFWGDGKKAYEDAGKPGQLNLDGLREVA